MARPLVDDEAGLSTLASFILVVVVIGGILGVYFGYVVPRFPGPPTRAQPGDFVEVAYIGTFPENGLVFDTSIASVGNDNASFPKAFSFTWREEYSSLPFTVGSGGVIKGFDQGVQGLAVGESRTIVAPPSLAYGPANASMIFVKPLFEPVRVNVEMAPSDFLSTYGTDPVSGTNVTDPFWRWPVQVSVADSVVTVRNSPIPGQLVRPHDAWNARVLSIDDAADAGRGRIVVQHLLDPGDADRIGKATVDPQGRRTVEFVVTAVDAEAGTYTLNFNDAVQGRTLVFQVTMVRITRPF